MIAELEAAEAAAVKALQAEVECLLVAVCIWKSKYAHRFCQKYAHPLHMEVFCTHI